MRVMVTGATTPLGAAIIDHLLAARDVDLVLAIGHEPAPRRPRSGRIVYRCADLTHARVVHDVVWGEARSLGIEVVVHNMVRGARELISSCTHHPTIRRFVYRSFAEIYASRDLIDEASPLDFDPHAPQSVRDRIAADVAVCAQLAGPLEVAVLRCADILAPHAGSALWDYLSSPVCLRPLGFDPMLNVLSLEDAAAAFGAAVASPEVGIFNIPGCDTLPLSRVLEERHKLAIPSPWLPRRFRLHGGVLDGKRARTALGYVPAHRVQEVSI